MNTNDQPRLTIVTVTRNDRTGLERTFRSLESQTIEFSKLARVEWVVIDGLSSDDTCDYISKIQFKGKFTFVSESDDGIFDAMNKGVVFAKGDYVLFLNSGDRLK